MRRLLSITLALFLVVPSYATTTDKINYGAASASMTCPGLSTEGSSQTAAISCASVDNTSTLALDYLITVDITSGASSPGNDQSVYVYAYSSEDGSNYEIDESSSPSSGGNYTLNSHPNFKLLGSIYVSTASKEYRQVFSLANAYGGAMPRKWGIVIENYAGQAFTAGTVTYTPILFTNN